MYREKHWIVNCNGHEFEAIGYETRGIFGVPIACFDETTGESISCEVYEIVKGFKKVGINEHISASNLNNTEIMLLENVGCTYDGCWIKRA